MSILLSLLVVFVASQTLQLVESHGRMVDPAARGSAWRYGFKTPVNYNDNEMYCGGFKHQWQTNDGKCGICGDPYDGERLHEAGGKFATGLIVRNYTQGQVITITIQQTAAHKGYYQFRICPVNNKNIKATEECLDQNILVGPGNRQDETDCYIESGPGSYVVQVKLPDHLVCSQCVLQWKYNTGNSWGCPLGPRSLSCKWKKHEVLSRCCVGCGKQEQFYGCADVAINPRNGGIPPTRRPPVRPPRTTRRVITTPRQRRTTPRRPRTTPRRPPTTPKLPTRTTRRSTYNICLDKCNIYPRNKFPNNWRYNQLCRYLCPNWYE